MTLSFNLFDYRMSKVACCFQPRAQFVIQSSSTSQSRIHSPGSSTSRFPITPSGGSTSQQKFVLVSRPSTPASSHISVFPSNPSNNPASAPTLVKVMSSTPASSAPPPPTTPKIVVVSVGSSQPPSDLVVQTMGGGGVGGVEGERQDHSYS